MTNLVKRLVYNEQKDWFNKNNWSIFLHRLILELKKNSLF
jgi:hypothetical protein